MWAKHLAEKRRMDEEDIKIESLQKRYKRGGQNRKQT